MSRTLIPSVRRGSADSRLGLLADLAGTWQGQGFNLIARPDKQGKSPLFLELNQTFETLSFVPISSPIPNRGSIDDDIAIFGLTYLQKITDSVTGGALHIEPGIWVHIPSCNDSSDKQRVVRMGNVPHGNSLLAQGTAVKLEPFDGNPFDPDKTKAVNTAPFDKGDGDPGGPGMPLPASLNKHFPPYDLSNCSPAAVNFRTPAGNSQPIPLPSDILQVPMQKLITDPTSLLTAALSGQTVESMVVINIASVKALLQQQPRGLHGKLRPPRDILAGLDTGGGIENIPFLKKNANAATMFATFWIERIADSTSGFMQLQYVQTVLLNFPSSPNSDVILSWPHVSVATLQKTFGGQ
jgi:hypothetical protein